MEERSSLRDAYVDRYDDGRVITGPVTVTDEYLRLRPDPVRSRKPKGILTPKPYSYTWNVRRIGYTEARFFQPGSSDNRVRKGPTVSSIGSGIPSHDPQLPNRAVIKALGKLKDQRINLGVALAETQQTADFVGSSAKRLFRAAKQMVDGEFKKAGRTLAGAKGQRGSALSVPRSWLEFNYAAIPVLQDVKGAIDELVGLPAQSWVTTVRAESRSSSDSVTGYTNTWAGSGVTIPIRTRLSCRAYVSLSYIPQNVALQSIARLGMLNPLEVAWEKVPFSFIADWFLPIGDWLSAFDATVGFDFLHGSLTQFSRVRSEADPSLETMRPRHFYLRTVRNAVVEGVKFDRSVYRASPFPRPPSFKSPLSLGHMANGLSLLATMFAGANPPPIRRRKHHSFE